MTEHILGIDLGTTNSMASLVTASGAEIIENAEESTHVPSVVTLLSETERLVGHAALAERVNHPEATFYSFKRFMGRGPKDVNEDLSQLPFPVSAGERDNILLGHRYSPEEMSSFVLSEIKGRAERILGHEVKKAVITVPAYFDDGQRQATRDAAEIAGLEAVRILNEPTAAAIAYGLGEKNKGKVVVYDFGGGTFDVSVLELKEKIFKVLSTHGDTHLGGDDLDNLLMESIAKDLIGNSPIEPASRQALKKVAEEIKIELTASLETTQRINLPQLGIDQEFTYSRAQFDAAIAPLVERTLGHIDQALKDADLTPQDIEDVVLVGGSTRVPLVRHRVQEFFGMPPHVRINPDQVVAIGAGIQGHLLAGGRRDFLLMDVIPLSLGIETLGGTFSKMIIKNASIPAKATEIFSTSVDNQTGIDLNIFQGEREFIKDCRKLGQFKLKGIPPMPAGLPKVEVTFFVDNNGLLTVSAKELRSEASAEIDIVPTHGLKRSEVSQMIRDSYEHAEEDFSDRNMVEFRAKAVAIEEGLKKVWAQADQFLKPEEIQEIEAHRTVLSRIAQGEDPVALKAAIDKMGDLTREFADSIMGQAARGVLGGDHS
ncbi:MAG: Fe-S protein assembly chaperone HscA [bacterium]|nr:Fe-S protein assembly chaperone HscA [bacterium]